MKVYIAGAITNNPKYKEQFAAAETMLEAAGYTAINPAAHKGDTYKDYIDYGLFSLMQCQAIYLLNGWQGSNGAVLEYRYAKTVGLEIMHEKAQ